MTTPKRPGLDCPSKSYRKTPLMRVVERDWEDDIGELLPIMLSLGGIDGAAYHLEVSKGAICDWKKRMGLRTRQGSLAYQLQD